MTAIVDTNIVVRHLTGDPPEMAARATAYLGTEQELLLADVIVAVTVYVLEFFYRAPRDQVAEAMRSLIAEAYLVACAESTGVTKVASFDRSIDRINTIERIEPPE